MGADEPQDTTRPSLEPPKLFGRRGKAAATPEESTQAPEAAEPAVVAPVSAPASEAGTTRIFEDAPLFTDVGSVDESPAAPDPAPDQARTRPRFRRRLPCRLGNVPASRSSLRARWPYPHTSAQPWSVC